MAAPVIVEIYPGNGAAGVILSDTISATFDIECDPTSVQINIEGPDYDKWSGPDMANWDESTPGDERDMLRSPGMKGMVVGTMSFKKVDLLGNEVFILDPGGLGNLWRTKAIFTPDKPLAINTLYKVYVVGRDPADLTNRIGASQRTVFDAVANPGNVGNGVAEFGGGYTGTINDTYNVEIIQPGTTGTAKFRWWKTSNPVDIKTGTTRLSSQLLDQGVTVKFIDDWQVGDSYTVIVHSCDRMMTTYTWSFTTGAGSIATVPGSVLTQFPTSPIIVTGGGGGGGGASFQIISRIPDIRATNINPTDARDIIVVFNGPPDPTTLPPAPPGIDSITVWAEPVNGIFDGNPVGYTPDRPLPVTVVINGNQIAIHVDDVVPGINPLTMNNAVYIELSSVIGTVGPPALTLGSNQGWFFSTTYSPLYTSARRIRLDLGPLIKNIPDDVLNLAIFEAGIEADAITFGAVVDFSEFFVFARRQFVTCMAESIILRALEGSGSAATGSGASKRLADLSIKAGSGAAGNIVDVLKKLEACKARWAPALTSAGTIAPGTSLRPAAVVKGELDPDRPLFGRGWEPTSSYMGSDVGVPAANSKGPRSETYRRWRRTYQSRFEGGRFGDNNDDDNW